MRIIGIIPARYASSRLPGKPLADIGGISMIMRVYLQAKKAKLDDVIIATDDLRIFNHALKHKANVVMTDPDHSSGTERVLEAVLKCQPEPNAIINIQGDEPFIDPESIQKLAQLLKSSKVKICTLVKEFDSDQDMINPNRVKVEIDSDNTALSFSRKILTPTSKKLQHIGLYGYKFTTLKQICALPPSPLELEEKLEQLRWLEAGIPIYTALIKENSLCVDTPEDLEKVREFILNLN